jgi:hypothetical protein
MRTLGSTEDELRVLVAKNYVIPFDSGVVVITDWNNHNWLDARRIKDTQYQNEKHQLTLTQDKKYVLSKCLADAPQMLRESSIEEYRIEENRIVRPAAKRAATKKQKFASPYEESFEMFWQVYPNKTAKGKAYDVWQLLDDNLKQVCTDAIRAQVEANHFWKDWINNGAGGDNAPHPTTWLNQRRWEDAVVPVARVGKIKIQASKMLDFTK